MNIGSKRPCDVLIIGGGSAGLRAAIEAHDAGANVLIISKVKRGDPHTVLARGGINAALGTMDPEDNWMIHAADTLREGEFLADHERVEVLCKNAPDSVNELVNWGARFHREKDGRLTQRFFGAHTYSRVNTEIATDKQQDPKSRIEASIKLVDANIMAYNILENGPKP